MTRIAAAMSIAIVSFAAMGSALAAPATTTLSLTCKAVVAADRDFVYVGVTNSTYRALPPGTLIRVRLTPKDGRGPVFFTTLRLTRTVPHGGLLIETSGPVGSAYAVRHLICSATVEVKIEPRAVPRKPPFNPENAKR